MSGPQLPSYREVVSLPVGFKDAQGELVQEAEVRPVTGADELYIGMSPEYNRSPNDLVYKTLLLSRTVTRLGDKKPVSIHDISKLHAMDVRALEYAVYRLTYGADALPEEDPDEPGG
ncbi:MAG: hypothetical protein H6739_34935 [Alphaproteobacteria bacterium]|nr:hypothetical protein [Alphaproteobacteria bacterium]